jgi:transposase
MVACRRLAAMTKLLSIDLRLRVVEAVEAGMSRRAAADRFGVAASAAIKWHELWRPAFCKPPC